MDRFIISTDADCVYVDYRKPTQRALGRVTAAEMEAYRAAGQFPPGNMGPKVESALRFLEHGGREVIITSYEHLRARRRAGTRIVRMQAGRDRAGSCAGTAEGSASSRS